MKIKTLLLCICIIFIKTVSFSQDGKYIYYFDENFKPVKKSKSVFTGVGNPENGLIKFTSYYNKTNQVVLQAYFTDSSLITFQGPFISYYANRSKEKEGNYVKGVQDGVWKQWDSTGYLIDSTVYDHGKKITGTTYEYYRGKKRSEKFDDYKKDAEEKISYGDSGEITSEVSFTGNKGVLKTYKNENTKIDTVFSREETEASFPGGESAWNAYIKSHIEKNINELIADGRSGTCRVRFIINKEGKVSDVEALTMKGTALADVAVKAIKYGPNWLPAMQYGKTVNAYREQPVTFTIQNR